MSNKSLWQISCTLILLCNLMISNSSCKKYLDAKPDKKMVIPSTSEDLQALLDNAYNTNEMTPSADEASSDDYYLPQAQYNSLTVQARMAYIWENPPSILLGSDDWARIYNSIYIPNVCLDALKNIQQTSQNNAAWNNVKGSALFMRALGFLRAVLIFAQPWEETTADTDYGIVLRLNSDFNEPSVRTSMRKSYEQILADLKEAAPLLPVTPKHVNRPSQPAVYALLARTYMSMRRYDSCYKYADLCLQLKHDLLNYSDPSEVAIDNVLYPFSMFHKEVIFSSTLGTYTYGSVAPYSARIDSAFYDSYDYNDLRKKAFYMDLFGDGYAFKGSYAGRFGILFVGIAVDEVFLMRAETHARAGRISEAMDDLNMLLKHRWQTGSFNPLQAEDQQAALAQILTERRKELIFRGLRWMDIKRLNKEGAGIIITRHIDGQTYTLLPNDHRYALMIPDDIIRLTGIPQNAR